MRLPAALQRRFFDEAEAAAALAKQRIIRQEQQLAYLRQFIRPKSVPSSDEWRKWRVAVIDGSNSASTSERLGGRYGAFAAGWLVFEGMRLVNDGYSAGHVRHEQTGNPEVTQHVVSLLRTKLEREAAVHCLKEERVDFVLLDGTFYGFRVDADVVWDHYVNLPGFERGQELARETVRLTDQLLASRKCVGVIKRTRINAIDGWLLYHDGNEEHCLGTNDKEIMTALLRPREWFAYQDLLGNPAAFKTFEHYRRVYRSWMEKHTVADRQALQRLAQKRANEQDLRYPEASHTARFYARAGDSAPPFEFELHALMVPEPLHRLLAYFRGFHNPVTGLPWPIDLVDEQVSIPGGFLREFVEEIEARLIRDPELPDKGAISRVFSYLNPQKPED
jgi:hypothetical protein